MTQVVRQLNAGSYPALCLQLIFGGCRTSSPEYSPLTGSSTSRIPMATRTHTVFINTVGLLYAFLGFSLSVLAALFGMFNHFIKPPQARPFHARPHLPRKLRGPRTVKSFSDQSRKLTVPKPPEHFSIEKECTHDLKSLRRRSKSLIPIITIDHFGSTNSLPKPALPVETSLLNPANTDDTSMDMSTMSRPKIKRRSSSPLVLPRAVPPPPPVPSPHESLPVPSRKGSKSSSFKTSCKTPSVADLKQDTFTMTFLRKARRKKSLTLRTQPYGAPYFCPPPLPIPNYIPRTTSPDHDTRGSTQVHK